MIKIKDLHKSYKMGSNSLHVLKGINFNVEEGELVAIMGSSGSGKSTLLNILGLLDRSNDGEYLLDGKSVERLSSRRHAVIRSKHIGIIFQSFNLVPRLSVIENVALPLTYKGMSHTKRLLRASEILKSFHLSEREYYMPWQLSGGQTQRVAIARALVNDPSLILADEPTGNLDSKASHIIMQELSDLHKRGNTIIMVTHNPDLTTYASRVLTMLDGKIATDTAKRSIPEKKSNVKRPLSTVEPKPKKKLSKHSVKESL